MKINVESMDTVDLMILHNDVKREIDKRQREYWDRIRQEVKDGTYQGLPPVI